MPCYTVPSTEGDLRREESHTRGALRLGVSRLCPGQHYGQLLGSGPGAPREKPGWLCVVRLAGGAGEMLLPSEVGSPEQFEVARPGAVHGRASPL